MRNKREAVCEATVGDGPVILLGRGKGMTN